MISIITPVYNTEKYLAECIESVLSQTNPNWELMLIDDGSTDNSGSICDRYAKRDNRIKVYHHKDNMGQFDSRMLGIINATGDYCTGLDSDDYLERDFVEILTDVANREKADILCWNIRSVSDGIETGQDHMPAYGEYSSYEFLKYVVTSTNHSFCNKLIRTKLLKEYDFSGVPSRARHSEDYILICPAICMSSKIYAIDSLLYNYRQLNDSVTHVYSAQRIVDYMDSSEFILHILADFDADTPEIVDAEYGALIATVGNMLKKAYKTRNADRDQVKQIRDHKVYVKLKEYENTKYISNETVLFMKLFRKRLDSLLHLVYGVIKHE